MFIIDWFKNLFFTNKNAPSTRAIHAVTIGWNSVDPTVYYGWTGDLPDCELDAKRAAKMCKKYKIPVQTLLTENAKIEDCKKALINALEGLKSGDILLIWVSGHGGQEVDTNGDEKDGYDEYLCAYDGPILDDTINDWFNYVPEGVCVLWICDTCHSGTMERSAPVFNKNAIPLEFKGQLILISGCTEKGTSQSTGNGGVLTRAMLGSGPKGKTPITWYRKAIKSIPKKVQQPQYVEYGNVNDKFRNGIIIK